MALLGRPVEIQYAVRSWARRPMGYMHVWNVYNWPERFKEEATDDLLHLVDNVINEALRRKLPAGSRKRNIWDRALMWCETTSYNVYLGTESDPFSSHARGRLASRNERRTRQLELEEESRLTNADSSFAQNGQCSTNLDSKMDKRDPFWANKGCFG